MKNAYVYRHIRKDTNEVFYIGIGINSKSYKVPYNRANSKRNRSEFWHYIVNKTDYNVEIVFDNLTRNEACEKEIELIAFYGRRDLNNGTLVNMTDGGDGLSGHVFSEDHKKKIGEKHKGRIFSEDTRRKMSVSAKSKILTEDHKQNISKALIGNKYSLGFKHTEETKKKVSEAGKGRQPMLGKNHSEETKIQIAKAMKGRFVSEETKLKMSIAGKKHWEERKNAV